MIKGMAAPIQLDPNRCIASAQNSSETTLKNALLSYLVFIMGIMFVRFHVFIIYIVCLVINVFIFICSFQNVEMCTL